MQELKFDVIFNIFTQVKFPEDTVIEEYKTHAVAFVS